VAGADGEADCGRADGDATAVGEGAGLALAVRPGVPATDALGTAVRGAVALGDGVVGELHALTISTARQQAMKRMRVTNESLLV
jgi:hypothetical protein